MDSQSVSGSGVLLAWLADGTRSESNWFDFLGGLRLFSSWEHGPAGILSPAVGASRLEQKPLYYFPIGRIVLPLMRRWMNH